MDTKRFIHLSRLEITGPLDMNTPLCVLREVAIIHNIKFTDLDEYDSTDLQEFIDILNESDSHQPSVPFPLEEYYQRSLVASFVNKFIEWPEDKLDEAFQTLRIYMTESCLPSVSNFSCGQLTPSNTRTLNACCLFRICTHYNLPVNSGNSMDQMAQAVKILAMDVEQSRKFMYRQIDMMSEDEISYMYLSSCHMITDN